MLGACPSAVLAPRALGVQRLAVVDPPWFTDEIDRLGAEYFRSQGFDVVYATHVELERGQLNIRPAEVYDWLVPRVPSAAEALFIGGNGFRVVSAIRALEQALARPVITANQALFWHALQLAGVEVSLEHFGQIFTHKLPA